MGETRDDRAGFLMALANLPEHPGSVPINGLVPVSGTPLGDRLLSGDSVQIDAIEFVRTIAVARLMMPQSVVRLSAGRESMSEELQALCFLAGANSIFLGERSEEHTSELQSLMRISYAVFCLKKQKKSQTQRDRHKLT